MGAVVDMKLALPLVVTGLVLALAPAAAQTGGGQAAFTLVAASQGGGFVWTDASGAQTNPTLTVPANTEITITARQGAQGGVPHNVKVGTNPASDNFIEADESVEYKFTSPASGTLPYVCTIHPDTMKGTVQVAGAGGSASGGDKDSPGPGALGLGIALLGAALLLRRR